MIKVSLPQRMLIELNQINLSFRVENLDYIYHLLSKNLSFRFIQELIFVVLVIIDVLGETFD